MSIKITKMRNMLEKIIKANMLDEKGTQNVLIKVEKVLEKIRESLKKKNINARVMLGGSAAKGTFLKNDFDCDVFVRFNYSNKERDLSILLEKALKTIKSIKYKKVHGSRDYFQAKILKINYEIIPVLEVNDPKKALNVTDMSPLHVEWVKNRLNEKLKKDIILTKLFCKAQKVYGAESYINGFSGHVIDILIIKYGGFIKLLKAAKKWNKKEIKEIIDVEDHHKGKDVMKNLNSSKTHSPLIIIDPIQPERNAAAALSYGKFERFKEKAKEFLEKSDKKFFEIKKIKIKDIKKKIKKQEKDKTLIIIEAKNKDGKEDIVGTKLLKVFEHLNKHLILNEFTIYEKNWEWDKKKKALMWFIVKKEKLSKQKEHMGPPLKARRAIVSFKNKHKDYFVKGDRLYTRVEREFRTPKEMIKEIIKRDYVLERVKKIKVKRE